MLEIQLEDNLWLLLPQSNDFYADIHPFLPKELWSEVQEDENNNVGIRYWPIYFPIGLLISRCKKMGWGMEIYY